MFRESGLPRRLRATRAGRRDSVARVRIAHLLAVIDACAISRPVSIVGVNAECRSGPLFHVWNGHGKYL